MIHRSISSILTSVAGTALLAAFLSACVPPQQTRQATPDEFAEKFPVVILGADMIHSPGGDMTARLPNRWVTIETEKLGTPRVFAVACDPEYTMSLVFCEAPVDNAVRAGYEQGGIRGLVDASFQRRQKNSVGRMQRVGESEEALIGTRRFGIYTYTTDSARTLTRVAIFFTNTHLYECAITHLNFTDRDLPDPDVLREAHRIVLTSVEW